MKYQYTHYSPCRIQIPETDATGNIVYVSPDPDAVKAALEANARNEQLVRRTLDPATAAKARIAPIATVPKAEPKIATDVFMANGGTYELPESNERVKELVSRGYLTAIAEPAKPVALKPETKPVASKPETKKAEAAPAPEVKTEKPGNN